MVEISPKGHERKGNDTSRKYSRLIQHEHKATVEKAVRTEWSRSYMLG